MYCCTSVAVAAATLASGYLLGDLAKGGMTFSFSRWPLKNDEANQQPEVSLAFFFNGQVLSPMTARDATPGIPNILQVHSLADSSGQPESAFLPEASSTGLTFLEMRVAPRYLHSAAKGAKEAYALSQLRRKADWAPKPIMIPVSQTHSTLLLEEFTPRTPSFFELVPYGLSNFKKKLAFKPLANDQENYA